MKTYAVLLMCIVMLIGHAVAEAQEYFALPDIQNQADKGWNHTYTDKYGRSVPVDIDIDVFGAEVAPVLRVGWTDFIEYEYVKNDPYEALIVAKKKCGGKTTYLYESYNGERIEIDKAYTK